MSMETFDNLDDDLSYVMGDIKRKVDRRLPTLFGEEKKRLIREVERNLEDVDGILKRMSLEYNGASPLERSSMRVRMSRREEDTTDIRARLKGRTSTGTGYDFEDDFNDAETNQRAQLLQGTKILERASDSVHRSRMVAEETDEVGVGILGELDRQGEALGRASDRLHDTDRSISKSRRVLKQMGVTLITNKLLSVVIILIELAILAAVVYLKFFR